MPDNKNKKTQYGHEIGRIGQFRWGGYGSGSIFFEEFLPNLRGVQGVEVFQEMADNDATVGAILFAIENLMRQTEFHIEPGGDTEADKEAAEFVESCMYDMERTWPDTLSEILSFLTYGWSYHEIVYKRRLGKTGSPVTNSKYSDGLIGWRKLPIRSQDTLWGWKYKEETDDLEGMIQCPPPDFGQIFIPEEKALHFRTRSRKDNPEGRSILRTAYRAYYMKKRIEEIEGYGMERDLAGFPVLYSPADLPIWDRSDPNMIAALANAEHIVSSIRRDAREGLVLPGGENGWKLELISSGSRRQFDTNAIIDRYDKRIATSMLADFVMLGQQAVGSFALADNKTQIFAVAIGTYLDTICEVFNNQGIRRLIDINGEHFKGITDYPTMEHGDIDEPNLTEFAAYIKDMVGIGALQPDEELEDEIRRIGHLPERKETDTPPMQPGEQGPQAGIPQNGNQSPEFAQIPQNEGLNPQNPPINPQQAQPAANGPETPQSGNSASQNPNQSPQTNRGSSTQTAQMLAQTLQNLTAGTQTAAGAPQRRENPNQEQTLTEDEIDAVEAKKAKKMLFRDFLEEKTHEER